MLYWIRRCGSQCLCVALVRFGIGCVAVLVLIGLGSFSSMVLILTLLLDGKKKRLGTVVSHAFL